MSDKKDEMLSLIEESFNNFSNGQLIEGIVVRKNEDNNGYYIDIGYKSEKFLSNEEFDILPEIGDVIKVYVINEDGKVTISKKRVAQLNSFNEIKAAYESNIHIKGMVEKRIKGGLIVDINGNKAFLPGSQISNKLISNFDQFVGKEYDFAIITFEEDAKNIILSRKKIIEDEINSKKEKILNEIEIGMEFDGKVKNITQYGAFIDLGGAEGLLYKDNMSWDKINHPSELLKIGDKLKVKVIDFDKETKKISLGTKQLVPHPWENIEQKYPEGSKVTGVISTIISYGAFLKLEPGVEGLIHKNEISWTKKIYHPKQALKEGDSVSAIIIALDKENQKISLGLKQMQVNPWFSIDEEYPIGKIVEKEIKSIKKYGLFVSLGDDLDGMIHISNISWGKRIEDLKKLYKNGQIIKAKVLDIDKENQKISLGIKQLYPNPWESIEEYLSEGSELEGKIYKVFSKGILVNISLNEEIYYEGFVPASHLEVMPKSGKLEDLYKENDLLPLKVIELDKKNQKLVLSVKEYFIDKKEELEEYKKNLCENKE